jgi:hypothetical protein
VRGKSNGGEPESLLRAPAEAEMKLSQFLGQTNGDEIRKVGPDVYLSPVGFEDL